MSKLQIRLKKIKNESKTSLDQAAIEIGTPLAEFHISTFALNYYMLLEEAPKGDLQHGDEDHPPCDYEGIQVPTILDIKSRLKDLVGRQFITGEWEGDAQDQLGQMKKDLKGILEALTAYGDQVNLLEHVYFKNAKLDEKMLQFESVEDFAGKVIQEVFAENEPAVVRDHLRYIYSELPTYMTKNRFLYYVDEYFKLLTGVKEKDFNRHVTLLKETFLPASVPGYDRLPAFAKALEQAEKAIIEGSPGDRDSAYHYLSHLTEDKVYWMDQAMDLVDLVNSLTGYLLVQQVIKTQPKALIPAKKIIIAKGKGQIDHQSLESIEVLYARLEEDMNALKMYSDAIEKVSPVLLDSFDLANTGLFQDQSPGSDKQADLQLVGRQKKVFIDFIETQFKKDDRGMKRARMAILMSIFNLVHGKPEAVYDYIVTSLKQCPNQGVRILTMQNIYAYLHQL